MQFSTVSFSHFMLICSSMSIEPTKKPEKNSSELNTEDPDYSHLEPKIYLLPNLMTAGNLLCGFLAVLSIFKGMHGELELLQGVKGVTHATIHHFYENAIFFIFGSCLFDLLDGRLARLGGQESPFGREFDSIADVISFGMAPALLVSKAVLFDLPDEIEWIGWVVSFSYLLCGAMRLARFNCLAAIPQGKNSHSDFLGIPIPMAAGFIASLTYLLSNFYEVGKDLGAWNYVLVSVTIGLSILMITNVRYPSFKKVDWSTKGSVWGILLGAIAIGLIFNETTRSYTPAVIFTLYLIYGLVRPLLSKKLRHSLSETIGG
jgi:CDP-diacylglycerol--serine O-phosphatidyltransferase